MAQGDDGKGGSADLQPKHKAMTEKEHDNDKPKPPSHPPPGKDATWQKQAGGDFWCPYVAHCVCVHVLLVSEQTSDREIQTNDLIQAQVKAIADKDTAIECEKDPGVKAETVSLGSWEKSESETGLTPHSDDSAPPEEWWHEKELDILLQGEETMRRRQWDLTQMEKQKLHLM